MAINLFQSSTNTTLNPFVNNSTPIQTQNNIRPSVSGSYRGIFKTERITYVQIDNEDKNTQLYTTNLFMQQEYKGISALQIRLEDYYLIRSQQIQDHHKLQIETAVRKNSFNPKMIRSQQNLKPPQFQDQGDIFKRSNNLFNKPIDNLQQPNNNQNIFTNPLNNNIPNNSNDLFNKNNNQSNIFKPPLSNNQLNRNNNQSTNLFQQQQSNNNSNNIFQQNNQVNNNNNNNIFNQQNNNNNNQQQNNNNIFNNQNLFSNNNNLINNSNTLFNQPLQSIQPFQYPTNNNIFQPIVQQSLLGSLDYLKFQENQFKDFTRQVDTQIVIMEQQKQATLDEYDSMLRDSINVNLDYQFQNQLTKSIKYNKSYKYQNQKSSNLSNKIITSRQDKKTISTFQPHSLNTEIKSIREDRKPISKFQENYQNTDSKSEFKSFAQKDDRKSQSILFLDLEIIFLESEKFLSISQEFQYKSKIYNVKQFVEEQLQNIEIFGSQQQQYFNNCLIYNNNNLIQDYNILLVKLTSNKLIFNYFYVKLPKLINDGYQSNLHEFPDFRKVQNFTVSNKFGKIIWTQQTNIYYLDLDKIIDIKQESIEVYDTTKINELLKPEIGIKLNSECFITFKFQLKNSQINQTKFKNNLITQAQQQGLQFISIDFVNYEYTVKSFHFSGYHFNSDYSNTDNINYQDQQQQVEIQNNYDDDVISSEQEENDSLSLEQQQNEFALQFKQKFDINFQNLRIQEKQINYQLSNQIINKYNQKFTQKVMIPLNHFQQNQQLQIDTQLLQNYFDNNNKQQDQLKNTQIISMLLLDCIYQFKNPTQEIIRSFQLLNILFGNPIIDIVNILQLHQNHLISLQDINKIPKIKNIRGFRLSLFLEQFKQVELREQLISQQQTQNLFQNVFLSLNQQPYSHIIIELNDWIDRFVDWRINRSQPQPLYEDQWWIELYNQQKDNQIASSQFASFIYYLLKKTKQPQKEYKKLYEYLYNNIDAYTIILFNIILRKQQSVSQQMKLIGRTIIAKLLKSQVSNQLIFNILETFKDKIFQKEELIRVRSILGKIGFINSINGKDLNDVDSYIDKKQFIPAVRIIIEKRLENQYYQILNEIILPYLIICDYYNEDNLKLIIKHIMNLIKGNKIMNIICQIYLQEIEMNEIVIINWITQNEYQYHLKQIILKIWSDQF